MTQVTNHSYRNRSLNRRAHGFTLTEMLIAMAITLLLMAALGKSFALMGESIREGRVKVNLTSQLRDITLRINSDLERCTVPLTPLGDKQRGDGYFVYYDGPLSDATGALMGRSPDSTNENSYQDSKFGDMDDYLAFTAAAEAGTWFRGKVPRFVLDAKTAELDGRAYDPTDFPGNPYDPIVITSKYAEVIYFASPEYQTQTDADDPAELGFVYNTDFQSNPLYVDFDTNGLPDRVKLHRRVLLIRPDLNLNAGTLAQYTHAFSTGGTSNLHGTSETVSYMTPDTWAVDTSQVTPSIKTVTINGISREQTANAWLVGMAPIHQQCDLSVRRTMLVNGAPGNSVVANSLADLTRPENRFAHVRIPHTQLATQDTARPHTSMPLLAMGGLPTILNPATNPAVPNSGTVITPTRLNGFIRPEFVLGRDYTHTDFFGDGWGPERLGEDVIATDVLGFNIQGFDTTAQTFISFGNDRAPGIRGFDDDDNGTPDDSTEVGIVGTDDVVVSANDASMREFLIHTNAFPAEGVPSDVGEFVDLFYPFQAGGTVRGFAQVQNNVHAAVGAAIPLTNFQNFLASELSGLTTVATPPLYTNSLFRSGRVLTTSANAVILVQPAFDTFSNHYESDGYLQCSASENGGSALGVLWYLNDGANNFVRGRDLSVNGLDDSTSQFGADDDSERETLPPFNHHLRAVKATIRLENPTTRQMEQMSSITHFAK